MTTNILSLLRRIDRARICRRLISAVSLANAWKLKCLLQRAELTPATARLAITREEYGIFVDEVWRSASSPIDFSQPPSRVLGREICFVDETRMISDSNA